MDIQVEREVRELSYTVVVQGRMLADEWFESGFAFKGTTKRVVKEALADLRDRKGHGSIEISLIELMGDSIRVALNELRDGKGDAALSGNVDIVWEQDQKVVDYVNLLHRWKLFHDANSALQDKLAAIRYSDALLTQLTL